MTPIEKALKFLEERSKSDDPELQNDTQDDTQNDRDVSIPEIPDIDSSKTPFFGAFIESNKKPVIDEKKLKGERIRANISDAAGGLFNIVAGAAGGVGYDFQPAGVDVERREDVLRSQYQRLAEKYNAGLMGARVNDIKFADEQETNKAMATDRKNKLIADMLYKESLLRNRESEAVHRKEKDERKLKADTEYRRADLQIKRDREVGINRRADKKLKAQPPGFSDVVQYAYRKKSDKNQNIGDITLAEVVMAAKVDGITQKQVEGLVKNGIISQALIDISPSLKQELIKRGDVELDKRKAGPKQKIKIDL